MSTPPTADDAQLELDRIYSKLQEFETADLQFNERSRKKEASSSA